MNQGNRRNGSKARNSKTREKDAERKKGKNLAPAESVNANAANREKKSNPASSAKSTAPPGFENDASTIPAMRTIPAEISHMMRERMIFAIQSLISCKVEVQVTNGTVYHGVLYTVRTHTNGNPDFLVVIKRAHLKNGQHEEGFHPGGMVFIEAKDLAQVYAPSAVIADRRSGDLDGIMTDTEISGNARADLFGRELESADCWLIPDSGMDGGLEEESRGRSRSKKMSEWNQFEANEKLFGVRSSYDENLYTTKLDKRKITSEQSREAAKIAKEIESQSTSNFHLAEERGQISEQMMQNLDEESRYSSVIRNSTKATSAGSRSPYIPPALRQRAQSKESQPEHDKTEEASSPVEPSKEQSTEKGKAIGSLQEISEEHSNDKKEESKKKDVKSPRLVKSPKATKSPKERVVTEEIQPDSSPEVKEAKDAISAHEANNTTSSPSSNGPLAATTTPTSTASEQKPKTTLNANAKEFKLSASAKSFTPKFAMQQHKPVSQVPHMHPRGPMMAMNVNMMQGGIPPQYSMNMYRRTDDWQYDQMLMDDGSMGMGYAGQYMSGQIPPAFVPGVQGGRHIGYPPMMPQMMNPAIMGQSGQMRMVATQPQQGMQQNMQQPYVYNPQSRYTGYPAGGSPVMTNLKHTARTVSPIDRANGQQAISPQVASGPGFQSSVAQPPLPPK